MAIPYDGIHGHLKTNEKAEFKRLEVKTKPVFNTKDRFIVISHSKNPKTHGVMTRGY